MEITDKHIDVLKASQALACGENQVINTGDAEECVDLNLVEPMTGYPLTAKGKVILETQT